jgi:hypothetical protein
VIIFNDSEDEEENWDEDEEEGIIEDEDDDEIGVDEVMEKRD